MIKSIQFVLISCLVFSLMSISIPSTGYACSCAELPSVEGELERSEAVFAGEVIKVNKNYTDPQVEAHFKVTKAWKGNIGSEVTIITGIGGGDCGYEFEEGKEYLVYASNSKVYSDNNLSTTICRRTTELATAKEDLDVLGEGKPTEPKATPIDLEQKGYIWYLVIPILLSLGATWFIKRKKDND